MSRFNKRPSGLIVPTPIKTQTVSTGHTYNQAPGFERDARSELFLLGVGNFVGQKTFYEDATKRDERYANLIRAVAVSDPGWMSRFLPWLRNEANMRTASIVGAVEAAVAMVEAGIGGGRALVNSVLVRADEPGEALGYARDVLRRFPIAVKRGIADAASRLYNERNTLKYDTASHAYRFGDVLELCHPKPTKPFQTALFKHLIDRRHGREEIPESLLMIFNNAEMRKVAAMNPQVLLASESLRQAGMAWEDVLSLAGSKVPKKELWEALIPTMGYMALLRNLRNFDEAGVSDHVAQLVMAKLADPAEIARSRQLPMRFLSAFNAASLRWAYPLEQALQWSLANVPEFEGSTLILIDTSGSMGQNFSKDGSLKFMDAAAVFGLAVASRCSMADVFSFSNRVTAFPLRRSESLLSSVQRFQQGYFQMGGTVTELAVRTGYRNHDRVVILTDEQANYHDQHDVTAAVPANKMVVTFNLAGYRMGHAPSGSSTRVTIGGLSDSAFKLLPVLERRIAGEWPF